MKDSAAGEDEITAGMLRWIGPEAKKMVFSVLSQMWVSPAEDWERQIGASLSTGVVFLLWKGKGSVKDLDKYRGIVLLSILSRWIARILAKRMSN